MLTSGYEFTTAITNGLIFIVSLFCMFNIKNNKLWKLFFILMCIDSFLGVIVHGFVMRIELNIILWVILTIFLTFTVNTLLSVFLNLSYKHIVIMSIILLLLLIIEIFSGINYLLTFDFSSLLILLICIYIIIKKWKKENMYFILGIIFQIIGGILMILKIDGKVLDHNGIYHLFMVLTLIYFYNGIKKNK